jgi:hypothetical protein
VLKITTANKSESPRDHAWAEWHTGVALIETRSDIARGVALIEEARAAFVANKWDPDQLPEMDRYLTRGRQKLH